MRSNDVSPNGGVDRDLDIEVEIRERRTSAGTRVTGSQSAYSEYIGNICPYCRFPIKPGQDIVICPACKVPHHEDCWRENGGCTTYGCTETTSAARRQYPPPEEVRAGPRQYPPPEEVRAGPRQYPPLEEVPAGFNWGAFWLTWIWGVGNNVWISFVVVVLPIVGNIYLGVKGNELAWVKRQWASVEEFKETQAVWSKWGWIIFVLQLVLNIIFWSIMGAISYSRR
jgi:hypothetical protein